MEIISRKTQRPPNHFPRLRRRAEPISSMPGAQSRLGIPRCNFSDRRERRRRGAPDPSEVSKSMAAGIDGLRSKPSFQPPSVDDSGKPRNSARQVGDEKMFDQIVAELNGEAAYQSLRRLEYLGGKRSVDALVKALDLSADAVQKAHWKGCGNSRVAIRT